MNQATESRFRYLKPRGSWVYLVAALPLLVFALVGVEYGALATYLIPALICVFQFFRPSKPIWLVLFVVYLSGTTAYVVALVRDLARLAGGGQPSILVDADDSIVFILLVIYLVAVCYGLYRVRPMFRGDSGENSFASQPTDGGEIDV